MNFRTAAVSVAALALPFSALGAPAVASDYDNGHDDPKVSIKKVEIKYKDDYKKVKDIDVKVRYRCDEKKNDDEGHLKVVVVQDDAKWVGHEDVECTGDWERIWVDLEKKDGRLEEGKAKVRATLEDPRGDKAKDTERVDIEGKDDKDDYDWR